MDTNNMNDHEHGPECLHLIAINPNGPEVALAILSFKDRPDLTEKARGKLIEAGATESFADFYAPRISLSTSLCAALEIPAQLIGQMLGNDAWQEFVDIILDRIEADEEKAEAAQWN